MNVEFNWRLDRESEQESATLTLDLSGLTMDQLLEYAYSDIVVKLQGQMRSWMKSDRSKPAPWKAGGVYKVEPKGTRVSADPSKKLETVKKALSKLTPEQIADLLASIG